MAVLSSSEWLLRRPGDPWLQGPGPQQSRTGLQERAADGQLATVTEVQPPMVNRIKAVVPACPNLWRLGAALEDKELFWAMH